MSTFFLFVSISFVFSSRDLGVQNKLNVHAPRDGTAAGRHGGAACKHVIFQEKLYLDLFVSYTVLYNVPVPSLQFLGSSSFVLVSSFQFLRSGSFVWFLCSGSFVLVP